MALSSSYINTNFHKIPLKPESAFRVSILTRKGPSATWLRPGFLDPKKPIEPLRVCLTAAAAPDELPEKPADPRWREIHGKDNWVGLLDPIDPALRAELLRYGDMAQACHEAFDSLDGGCKFAEDRILTGVDSEDCGYNVTRYLYATQGAGVCDGPDLLKKLSSKDYVGRKQPERRWAGYVAVSNDEQSARMGRRDITVAWRGVDSGFDWIGQQVLKKFDRIPCHDPSLRVGSGFERLYTAKDNNCDYCRKSPREQVLEEIGNLVEQHINKIQRLSITLTGHGLGSALAVLCAFDVAETGRNLTRLGAQVPISVFSFSGPRVGDKGFKERLELLGVKVLRVHNVHDVVPRVPGVLVNERSWPWLASLAPKRLLWSHVGTELALDHTKSPFIKAPNDASAAHNLELLLHLIDGYHGSNARFRLGTPRDIALLNKDANLLRKEFKIPAYWRRDMNTASVMKKNAPWTFTHHSKQ